MNISQRFLYLHRQSLEGKIKSQNPPQFAAGPARWGVSLGLLLSHVTAGTHCASTENYEDIRPNTRVWAL